MEDSITIPAKSGHTLFLGRQGENLARHILFDLTAWLDAYGEGRAALAVLRSGDTLPYPASNTRTEGDTLIWTPTAADTDRAGYGKCELRWYVGDVLVKSELWMTFTASALGETSEAPDPTEDFIAAMQRIGSAVQEAERHAPCIGENGNWWLWNTENEAFADSGHPARGETGPQGERGDPGDAVVDVTLGVLGASVGQTVKIKTVDANGSPTAWEAVSGGGGVTVDSALSATSEDPVQNKAIKAALDAKAAVTSVPAAASVSAAGVMQFKNSAGTQLFTVQLPLYAGGVS